MVSQALIDISVTLIMLGVRKYEQVPTAIKEEVKATLAALGRGTDGQPLPGEKAE